MGRVLRKIVTLLIGDDTNVRPEVKVVRTGKLTDRDLLKQESKIGATLFGPVPKGHNREFFCLDESTWIWHEEWKDEKGVARQATVRYEIHPKGVLKVSEGPRYQFIEGQELHNFAQATRLYYEQTAREVYKRDPKTGLKFA
jgi:hypothetical protein